MRLASYEEYRSAGIQAHREGKRRGTPEYWARVREILNAKNIMTHSQMEEGLVVSR